MQLAQVWTHCWPRPSPGITAQHLWDKVFKEQGRGVQQRQEAERGVRTAAAAVQTARSVWSKGQELLQELRLPCSPWYRPCRGSCAPAARGGHSGAGTCVQPLEEPSWSWSSPEGGCEPLESLRRSRFAVRTCDFAEDPR